MPAARGGGPARTMPRRPHPMSRRSGPDRETAQRDRVIDRRGRRGSNPGLMSISVHHVAPPRTMCPNFRKFYKGKESGVPCATSPPDYICGASNRLTTSVEKRGLVRTAVCGLVQQAGFPARDLEWWNELGAAQYVSVASGHWSRG